MGSVDDDDGRLLNYMYAKSLGGGGAASNIYNMYVLITFIFMRQRYNILFTYVNIQIKCTIFERKELIWDIMCTLHVLILY